MAMRELKRLKTYFEDEEDLEIDLDNWVQGKISQIQDDIVDTFKMQRDRLV